jgi:hypothetical protein
MQGHGYDIGDMALASGLSLQAYAGYPKLAQAERAIALYGTELATNLY